MTLMYRSVLISLGIIIAHSSAAATLRDTIQQTVKTHPEVNAALNSRLSADQDLNAAKGGYLPSVTLNAGTGHEETDSPATRAGGNHRIGLHRSEAGIRMEQMVFDGFATPAEIGRQTATVNSRVFRVLNVAENVALDTVKVYFDVLQRRELVTLAENNLASHERIYDQIKLRSERGVGRLADMEQAEARLAQARNNLITEQTNLDDAETNFFSVTGTEPSDLTLPDDQILILPDSLQNARAAMVTNSPILKSAESDIEATEQQYEASKAAFYPRVDVELARNIDNNIDGTRGHNNEWQAMLRMRYNIYAGGSDKAGAEAKAFQIKEAQEIRNNTLRQLNEELRLAWSALGNARKQLPVATEYANRSMKVRTAYQKQFSIGERTLLDVLDSENELFTAQRRLVEIQYTERFSRYRIKARMGEILQDLSVSVPLTEQDENNAVIASQLPSLN
ncbi:TPA: TolC family outer membrane protein [Morganella morganii]|uniref:TolC family outer membrane protein n=1 Tax=bacterium 19GA11TI05 TaxID=2920688 RepID=A0AAU6TYA1_UNCXX|nr:TolC family outer membrane protein [Morganella morganii]HCC5749947.1 TolC family outer membrane protein [Morganella morganii]